MAKNVQKVPSPIGKLVALLAKSGGFRPFDLGVLKVALMFAAVDGRVIGREVAMFGRMARKCRGWTPEAEAKALDAGLRAAGYLQLQARRLSERQLVELFVREAVRTLPRSFAARNVYDQRRAFVMWALMCISDLEPSLVEYKCALALRNRLGLEHRITTGFFRELKRQIARLFDEETCDDAAKVFKTFIDVDVM